ncbi:MAG: pyrroline-5-carboxylate reductase [Geminicoccaceae bacterium]|nr:MAG: pyrroline-5-carboxylate reductase [Geminicoccaceae bacterium]
MGSALALGWLQAGLAPAALQIVEPDASTRNAWAGKGCACAAELAGIADWPAPRALVLAVKPQKMSEVLAHAPALIGAGTVVVSIAAGTTLETLQTAFGAGVSIVRTMPNTPASVGRGATALYATAAVPTADRELAEGLLATVGLTAWLSDEAQMHAVTALSGGGPAYVFLLIETLARAGVKAGLPDDLAMALARATVSGAGELARLSTEPAAVLRQNVTSPGGTTAEALAVLMAADGIQPLFDRAIDAAAARSEALGRGAAA